MAVGESRSCRSPGGGALCSEAAANLFLFLPLPFSPFSEALMNRP